MRLHQSVLVCIRATTSQPHAPRRYNGSLIVTLTVNPALDRTLSVDRLAFEDRAYIESRHEMCIRDSRNIA